MKLLLFWLIISAISLTAPGIDANQTAIIPISTGKVCKCSANGDPHYTTFDRKYYTFMGACSYIVFETKLPKRDKCYIRVISTNWMYGLVSYVKFLTIQFRGYSIEIHQKKVTSVNGMNVTVPYSGPGYLIFAYGRYHRFTAPSCQFKVDFDGNTYSTFQTSLSYKGKLQGLCGDCDGDASNEYRTKSGKLVSSINTFGNSWAVTLKSSKGSCRSTKVEPPAHPCSNGNWSERVNKFKYCGFIRASNSPFAYCVASAAVKVEQLFQSCRYDVCEAIGNEPKQHTVRCEMLYQLERRCVRQGFYNIRWRALAKCGRHEHGPGASCHCCHRYPQFNPCGIQPGNAVCPCAGLLGHFHPKCH